MLVRRALVGPPRGAQALRRRRRRLAPDGEPAVHHLDRRVQLDVPSRLPRARPRLLPEPAQQERVLADVEAQGASGSGLVEGDAPPWNGCGEGEGGRGGGGGQGKRSGVVGGGE